MFFEKYIENIRTYGDCQAFFSTFSLGHLLIPLSQKSFGKRYDHFGPKKITNNSSRRTPRQDFDHQIEFFFGKKSKMMKIGILIN